LREGLTGKQQAGDKNQDPTRKLRLGLSLSPGLSFTTMVCQPTPSPENQSAHQALVFPLVKVLKDNPALLRSELCACSTHNGPRGVAATCLSQLLPGGKPTTQVAPGPGLSPCKGSALSSSPCLSHSTSPFGDFFSPRQGHFSPAPRGLMDSKKPSFRQRWGS
jgi:hypothetical protein